MVLVPLRSPSRAARLMVPRPLDLRLRTDFDWSKKYRAHGAPIQFGWEAESVSQSVLHYYRPRGFTDEAWLKLPLAHRLAQVPKLNGAPNWRALQRMAHAPEHLDMKLSADMGGWELRPSRPAETPLELFEQTAWMRVRVDRNTSFHYHISFVRPPQQRALHERLIAGLAAANEYAAAKMFEGESVATAFTTPPHPLDNREVPPYSERGYDASRAVLAGDAKRQKKLSTVSLRAGQYGKPKDNRIAFEVRAANQDVDRAQLLVARLTTLLSSGGKAPFKLGTAGRPYALGDVVGVERIGDASVQRLRSLVAVRLEGQRQARWLRASADEGARELFDSLSMPLVRWEERSHFPASAVREIRRARGAFIDELARHLTVSDVRSARFRHDAALALRRFLRTTRLAEYL